MLQLLDGTADGFNLILVQRSASIIKSMIDSVNKTSN